MQKKLIVLVAGLSIAGCAPTIWDKPGGTQAEFNQENARCRLVARGMNSGDFYAQGSPGFVAGATIGNAIGTAINTAATYRDCMMAIGYTPRGASETAEPVQAAGSGTDQAVASWVSDKPGHCSGGGGRPDVCEPD